MACLKWVENKLMYPLNVRVSNKIYIQLEVES